jgi:abortive infection bacteriophage resistance protein
LFNVPSITMRNKLYIHICCMKYLVDTIDESNHLAQRFKNLFNKYPNIDKNALGFIDGWENEPLWE